MFSLSKFASFVQQFNRISGYPASRISDRISKKAGYPASRISGTTLLIDSSFYGKHVAILVDKPRLRSPMMNSMIPAIRPRVAAFAGFGPKQRVKLG